jgi:hypothetical protein
VTFPRLAIATVLMLAQALSAARAQPQTQPEPATLVREGLAAAYGTALIAELGKNLRSSADPACLASKGIAADQFEARGLELMTKWGARMMETSDSLIDKNVYAEKFSAGAELTKLQADGNVKRYLVIAQPIRQAKMLDAMFEQFDHYVTIKRIKLAPTSPAATGNEALLRMNPADAAEDLLDKFVAANKSAAVKRYLALAEQDSAARAAAIRKDRPQQPVPVIFYQGVESDLDALCISRR